MSAFEMTWTQAINATEHMNQLLLQDPLHKGALKLADKTLSTVG